MMWWRLKTYVRLLERRFRRWVKPSYVHDERPCGYCRFVEDTEIIVIPAEDYAAGMALIGVGGTSPPLRALLQPKWQGRTMNQIMAAVKTEEIARGNYIFRVGEERI